MCVEWKSEGHRRNRVVTRFEPKIHQLKHHSAGSMLVKTWDLTRARSVIENRVLMNPFPIRTRMTDSVLGTPEDGLGRELRKEDT